MGKPFNRCAVSSLSIYTTGFRASDSVEWLKSKAGGVLSKKNAAINGYDIEFQIDVEQPVATPARVDAGAAVTVTVTDDGTIGTTKTVSAANMKYDHQEVSGEHASAFKQSIHYHYVGEVYDGSALSVN